MKQRFNTYDIICSVTELQKLIGMRVNQVYDIDNKTYLIKLQKTDEKCVLLIESGSRFHTTAFEWPKNVAPSGFSMKLRKHLKNKRLESLQQLGCDRIVTMQFGSGEAAYHVILELYDRGNIVLADFQLTILNLLRPRTEGEAVRFAVREKYPLDRARQWTGVPTIDCLKEMLEKARPGDNLRRALNPHLEYGPAVLDHVLLTHNLSSLKMKGEVETQKKTKQIIGPSENMKSKNKKNKKQNATVNDGEVKAEGDTKVEKAEGRAECEELKTLNVEIKLENCPNVYDSERDLLKIQEALQLAEQMIVEATKNVSKGYIIQKQESGGAVGSLLSYQEFHPFLFAQYKDQPYLELETFNQAVDEFYSALEGQRIDIKALQQEREALKKLSNVRSDHEKRLQELENTQEIDKQRAELITRNQELVDNAIKAVQTLLANQISWPDIQSLVKQAQATGDPIASHIKQLKLETNHITLHLTDPYAESSGSETDEDSDTMKIPKTMLLDIDLALSAYANARRYYDQKRTAAKKQQKTLESQGKALKSAEKKTKQTLKDVQTMTTISKARKAFWFEKFYWFISSENFLVIGGRDQQQNEIIVKRYLRGADIYVHADIQGASSIIIKNPSGNPIPPKTLNEAGIMAVAYSVAWDAKVVTTAWWVNSDQVSKTAPTGEYLTTGSFMIRGKKNYLPPCQMSMGLSFLFKLEDSSIERHKGERRVKLAVDDFDSNLMDINDELDTIMEQEVELEGSDSQSDEDENKLIETELDLNLDDNEDQQEVQRSGKVEFPDTQFKVDTSSGKIEIIKHENLIKNVQISEDNVVYLGDDIPVILKPSLSKKVKKGNTGNNRKMSVEISEENTKKDDDDDGKLSTMKRGHKGKLKKMKEKYKYQDEEEKQLRMQILQSAGTGKESKKNKKLAGKELKRHPGPKPVPRPQEPKPGNPEQDEQDDTEIAEREAVEIDMLDSLSGQPVNEDELLFAIPVIAPYNTLAQYKFKVKLTPGTGRRGKAARTAVSMFVRDKACSQREKDLIRSVRDDTLARNIPGKVKLSAPHLHRHK